MSPPERTLRRAASRRALVAWYGLMAAAGFGFGVVAERRPFGENVLAHPFIVFFIVTGLALIGLRLWLARPVPEVIPERALLIGCVAGVIAFLAGNWLMVHLWQ